MDKSKSTTLTLRIDPMLKEALRRAAILEHRSLTNMIEALIRSHCFKNAIQIPDFDGMSNVAVNIINNDLVNEKS